MPATTRVFAAALSLVLVAPASRAQTAEIDNAAVIAVADSVLVALSSGDNATLERLTLDSAIVGGAGVRNGVGRLLLGSWAPYTSRTAATHV